MSVAANTTSTSRASGASANRDSNTAPTSSIFSNVATGSEETKSIGKQVNKAAARSTTLSTGGDEVATKSAKEVTKKKSSNASSQLSNVTPAKSNKKKAITTTTNSVDNALDDNEKASAAGEDREGSDADVEEGEEENGAGGN